MQHRDADIDEQQPPLLLDTDPFIAHLEAMRLEQQQRAQQLAAQLHRRDFDGKDCFKQHRTAVSSVAAVLATDPHLAAAMFRDLRQMATTTTTTEYNHTDGSDYDDAREEAIWRLKQAISARKQRARLALKPNWADGQSLTEWRRDVDQRTTRTPFVSEAVLAPPPPPQPAMSIARRRMEEDLRLLQEKAEQELRQTFRARPVPPSSMPRSPEERRRRPRTANNNNSSGNNSNNSNNSNTAQPVLFKANPVPAFVREALELARANKKLPVADCNDNGCTFRPIINRTVPDFGKLHARSATQLSLSWATLAKEKSARQVETPKPKSKAKPVVVETSAVAPPRETRSSQLKRQHATALVQAAVGNKNQQTLNSQAEDSADAADRAAALRAKVAGALRDDTETRRAQLEERLARFKREQAELTRGYRRRLAEMDARLDERPCLFVRESATQAAPTSEQPQH